MVARSRGGGRMLGALACTLLLALQAAAEEDAAVGAGEAQSAERGGKKPPCGKPCNHVDNPYGAPAVDVDEEDTAQPDKLATEADVDALIAQMEAKEVGVEDAKKRLRARLWELNVHRVKSGGKTHGSMSTPVKTASVLELKVGAKLAVAQAEYEKVARVQRTAIYEKLVEEATGKKECVDAHGAEECLVFAKQGECKTNEEWMADNCAMTCGVCADDTEFLEGGFVAHLRGMKGVKKYYRKTPMHVLMYHMPGCEHCMRMKPMFAASAKIAKDMLSVAEVGFAAIDCSRAQATCLKQEIHKYPTFKFYGEPRDWMNNGSTTYAPETNPADPSLLGTTRFLAQRWRRNHNLPEISDEVPRAVAEEEPRQAAEEEEDDFGYQPVEEADGDDDEAGESEEDDFSYQPAEESEEAEEGGHDEL